MLVTFYQTNLTPLQRMIDSSAYDNYFNLGVPRKVDIEVNNLVVENTDFFISAETYTSEALNLFNYIKWTNNNITYCAFITGITYLANNKTYRVSHRLDSWAFACYNTGFNIFGKCSRAHVNDIKKVYSDKTADYTLKNTLNVCEESFNTTELEILKHDISNTNTPLFDKTQFPDIHFIYVYINNPEALEIVHPQRLKHINSDYNSIHLNGNLICGTINISTGMCFFRIFPNNFDGNFVNTDFILLESITSQYITSIFISDIPPVQMGVDIEIKQYGSNYVMQNKNTSIIGYNSLIDMGSNTSHQGQVIKTNCTFIINLSLEINYNETQTLYNHETNEFYNPFYDQAGFEGIVTLPRSRVIITDDFDDYLLHGIPKSRSHIYNPFYFNEYQIDFTHFKELKIGLSPEGSFVWYEGSADNRNMYSAIGSYAYTMSFAPDTVRDYWTVLSAERSTISSQRTLNNAEWNYTRFLTSGIFGVVTDTINLMAGTAETAGSIMGNLSGKNPNPAIAVGTGLRQQANYVEYTGNLVDFIQENSQRKQDLKYQRKVSSIDIETANQQKIAGITTNYTSTSYYANYYYLQAPLLTTVKLDSNNLKQVSYKLHRFGYNTSLTLEEVYHNHRREKFNFIATVECEVLGVPTYIANDIQNMFNNGVTLWSSIEVGNYQQTNYQAEVDNV